MIDTVEQKRIQDEKPMDSILLKEAALKLSPFERAQLIDALLQSLDSSHQAEIDQAWLKESIDRLSAYQRGEIKAIDGEMVLSQLKDKLQFLPADTLP